MSYIFLKQNIVFFTCLMQTHFYWLHCQVSHISWILLQQNGMKGSNERRENFTLIVSVNLNPPYLKCGDGRKHIFKCVAVHCSTACPSHGHKVIPYPLLIMCFSRTTFLQISMQRAQKLLTSSDFKFKY